MIFDFTFVNQVVGVVAGHREVAFHLVTDSERFSVPESDIADFPPAVDLGWRKTHRAATKWHDGSHWRSLGGRPLESSDARKRLGTEGLAPVKIGLNQSLHPKGTRFRTVIEDYRPEIVERIQAHFDRNVALLNGEIWYRAGEPCYLLKFDGQNKTLNVALVESTDSGPQRGYRGQRFRLDEVEAIRDCVDVLLARDWRLPSDNGVIWDFPTTTIITPESIRLDAEAHTILDLAHSHVRGCRGMLPEMSYREMEAYAFLKDATAIDGPAACDEDEIGDILAGLHLLNRFTEGALPDAGLAALALATDRWDNREISPILVNHSSLRI